MAKPQIYSYENRTSTKEKEINNFTENQTNNEICNSYSELNILNKKFLCFFPNSCYDIKTFTYNKTTNTYNVDYMYEQDPTGDLDYPLSKCPYDKGYITHLIFNINFSPTEKNFNATYKGFASSTFTGDTNKGYSNKILNIYYNTNPNIIYGIENDINHFKNKTITYDPIFIKSFDTELKCIYNRFKH